MNGLGFSLGVEFRGTGLVRIKGLETLTLGPSYTLGGAVYVDDAAGMLYSLCGLGLRR